ncbi:hypothetical protein EOW77_0033310 [Bradyrhizobium yuanmingense]|uniref:hypothetical protein n=1 Tax=Bradyrhizobium yuanmingense TaxID=108015 RepID=UPI000FE31BFC|nr:hypothetical protein [Bradyrhizobium yuanmingense]TGN75007.1 hypothetical protein EOW77_0033310 [Bradyrhizobium yuanmingense]
MALPTEQLIEIERLLATTEAGTSAVADLRRRFPQLTWVLCDASDVTEEPFRRLAWFDLHLIDGSDQCILITADQARATGLALARRNVGR